MFSDTQPYYRSNQLRVFTSNPLPDKSQITLYRAKDGIGVGFEYNLSAKHNFKIVDKLYYNNSTKWKYVELKSGDGSIVPLVYGFFIDTKKEPPSVMVANKSENIKAQALVNSELKECVWFLFLDRPITDKNAFEIYVRKTSSDDYEPLY